MFRFQGKLVGEQGLEGRNFPSMCVVTLLANTVFKNKFILFWTVQNVR